MIPFKKYFILEALVTHDERFWQQIRNRWLNSVSRVMTGALDEDKKRADNPKRHPDYMVTGPDIQYEFYEFSELNLKGPSASELEMDRAQGKDVSQEDITRAFEREMHAQTVNHVVYVERRIGGYPDSYYTLLEYDIAAVKDWWKDNWSEPDYGYAGPLPPELTDGMGDEVGDEPGDMWKHQDDQEDVRDIVQRLKSAIEHLEPAKDVKVIYWDAVEAGADKEEIDADLQHYVKIEYLTQQEVDMIKEEPPGLEEFL